MADDVRIELSRDEALVLFEWLHRNDEARAIRVEDPAEQRVLWDLEARLEAALAEPLDPAYDALLAEARACVRDRA